MPTPIKAFSAAVGAVALAGTALACGSGDPPADRPSGPAPSRSAPRSETSRGPASAGRPATAALVGFVTAWSGNEPTILARLDRLSLKPRRPRAILGEYHDSWSLSPDRSRLALGISASTSGGRVGIRIVDRGTLRTVKDVDVGIAAEALGWLAPDRLAGLLQSGDAVVVEPTTGEVLSRVPVAPRAYCFPPPPPSATTPSGLALVLATPGAPWRPRLVLVEGHGGVRTVSLARIRVARREGLCERVGLVVDPLRSRAFVVAARAPVAEIDLATMRVRYHRVAGPRSLPTGRPRRCPARSVCAARRGGLWLGHGFLAVSGQDIVQTPSGDIEERPAGVALIDTNRWTGRIVHTGASGARLAAGRLLVFERGLPLPARQRGMGLHAYTVRGRKLFEVAAGERVWDVQVNRDRAYVRSLRALRVLDVGRAEVVARFPPVRSDIELLIPP